MAAVLDTLAAHADQLARLSSQAQAQAQAASLTTRLDKRLSVLAARLDQITLPGEPGWDDPADTPRQPLPPRHWHKLTGTARDQAIGTLRAWVDQVYRPGYGHLAATLAPCWDQHPLCLYGLDILAELWSVLYLTTGRTTTALSSQAEYQARILPALAAQMTADTSRCRPRHNPAPTPNTSPYRSTP